MPGICFHFEPNDVDVWSGREIDLDAWNYAIKAAGDIDRIIVVNRTDRRLRPLDADIPFEVYPTLPDHLDDGRSKAFVCSPQEPADERVSLWDFDHDVDWYLFGPASGWQWPVPFGVYVPTANPVALHAVHAATVVMAHRHMVVNRGR